MRMICFSDKGMLNRRLPAPRKRFALFAIFLQIIMFLISSISLGLRLSVCSAAYITKMENSVVPRVTDGIRTRI